MGRWLSLAGIALALLYLEGFLFVCGNTVDSCTKPLLTNEERAAVSTVAAWGPTALQQSFPGYLMALLNCGDVIPVVGLALELW